MTEPEPLDLPRRLRAQADDFLAGRNRVLQVSGGGFLDTPVVALLQEAADALEQRLGLLRDTERRLEETVAELVGQPSATRSTVLAKVRELMDEVDRFGARPPPISEVRACRLVEAVLSTLFERRPYKHDFSDFWGEQPDVWREMLHEMKRDALHVLADPDEGDLPSIFSADDESGELPPEPTSPARFRPSAPGTRRSRVELGIELDAAEKERAALRTENDVWRDRVNALHVELTDLRIELDKARAASLDSYPRHAVVYPLPPGYEPWISMGNSGIGLAGARVADNVLDAWVHYSGGLEAKAAMFRRRSERLQEWFALPPDQRHPLGPELSPDIEADQPSGVLDAWAQANGLSADLAETRAAIAARVGLARATAETEGITEAGPTTLRDLVRIAPSSDPEIGASLGLRHPHALPVGPITITAHYFGQPAIIAGTDPSMMPRRIFGSQWADVKISLNGKRLDVFERDGGLVAATVDYHSNKVEAIDPLVFGRFFVFEGMVLHFFPGNSVPDSLYRPGEDNCDGLLPLDEFRNEIARLLTGPEAKP